MQRIAIFASGRGSNALKILKYFETVPNIEVGLVVSNRKNAGVLSHAEAYDIATFIVDRSCLYDSECTLSVLEHEEIDLIVLAGFLWLIPTYMIEAYTNKIINIHPSLLPKHGGEGMYGKHVHAAVKNAGDTVSGISIHYVNEEYDEGRLIFQAECQIDADDDVDTIAQKVQSLEHKYYSTIIHEEIQKINI